MFIMICCLVFAATHLRPDYPTRIVILSERSELRPVHPGRFCGTKGTHVAAHPCSLADPLGSPISFLFRFLQAPLRSPKPQPLSFQSILNSLHKTPGVGVPFRLSSPPLLGTEQRLTDHDLSPMSIFFFPIFLFPVFRTLFHVPYLATPLFATLTKNCRGCTRFFPKWKRKCGFGGEARKFAECCDASAAAN